jgi:hypothetical protein
MLLARQHIFTRDSRDLPGYSGPEGPASVTLKHTNRIFELPRRLSEAQREVQNEHCDELLAAGIIAKSPPTSNQYAANNHFPPKKDENGTWCTSRFVTDFRRLNEAIEQDTYLPPLAEDLLDRTKNAKIFTLMDLKSGYNQIPIAESDRKYFQFWWKNELFHYNRLPQGACTSSKIFQRIMDAELARHGLSAFCCAYQDDLLIWSDTADEHIEHVRRVLDMCDACNLRIHPAKSTIAANTLDFLGFQISQWGLSPTAAKCDAIRAMTPPTNADEVRVVMGFLNYYRQFVPQFSAIANPINQLLRKNVPFVWGPAQQDAFDTIRRILCDEGRALRRLQPDLPITVYCDWSQRGISAILAQVDPVDNVEYMVACVSRSLNCHEARYEPT